MENYEQLTAIQIENENLRIENQKLISQNATKDDYISKLEEKINCMEKYINELEKENQSKSELYETIANTKVEFEKLKKNWGEKYQRLEDRYTKLKYKYENQKMMIPHRDNEKIDKCISNINNVIATLNIK